MIVFILLTYLNIFGNIQGYSSFPINFTFIVMMMIFQNI